MALDSDSSEVRRPRSDAEKRRPVKGIAVLIALAVYQIPTYLINNLLLGDGSDVTTRLTQTSSLDLLGRNFIITTVVGIIFRFPFWVGFVRYATKGSWVAYECRNQKCKCQLRQFEGK